MQGDREPKYYTVEFFEEIDGFEPDQYGNIWYSVKMVDDAETYMWLKKDAPSEGQKVYGHTEPTKSGKRLRFKTDKIPDDMPRATPAFTPTSKGASADNKYLKDITDIPMRFMQTLLQYYDPQRLLKDPNMYESYIRTAESLSADALSLIEKVRSGSFEAGKPVKEPSTPPPEASKAPSNYQFRKKDEVVEPEEDWTPTDEDYSG